MNVRFEQVSLSPWNIKNSYEVGTKVKHNGVIYVSVKAVPIGINIGFGEYWKKLSLTDDVEQLIEAVDAVEEDVSEIEEVLYGTTEEDGLIERVEALEDEIDTSVTYSSTEKEVGKWVNGKTLYEKTIYIEDTFSQVYRYTLEGIDELFILSGYFKGSIDDADYYIPLNYYEGGNALSWCIYNKTTSKLTLKVNDYTGVYAYVTVRYTKATV